MPKQRKNNEINEQEKLFVDIYLGNGMNSTYAYSKIKPSATYDTCRTEGPKMLAKPCVKLYMENKLQELRNKQEVKLEYLVSNLRRVIDDCAQETTERDDTGRILSKPDRQSLIKAADVLAKLVGLYDKKVEITTPISTTGDNKITVEIITKNEDSSDQGI